MSVRARDRLVDASRLVHLSSRLIAGRRYWIVPLLVLPWPVFQLGRLAIEGWRQQGAFTAPEAQGLLIGFPLVVLAIGLGVRIVAGDIDRRTLEIAYTVPGGAHRAWMAKLIAALLLILGAEAVLAVTTFVFATEYPFGALYGAMQAAVFYLVLAMAMSTLFKSEATGAMVTVALLVVNGVVTGFGGNQVRVSPFWNPAALPGADPADLIAWTVQNRVGFLLVIPAIAALAFGRAERRESMLGG
jgi:hypothetical protein